MHDVVVVQEGHSAGELQHEAAVGARVRPPGEDELVEVSAFAELHDEPQVAGLLRVAQHPLACRTGAQPGPGLGIRVYGAIYLDN